VHSSPASRPCFHSFTMSRSNPGHRLRQSRMIWPGGPLPCCPRPHSQSPPRKKAPMSTLFQMPVTPASQSPLAHTGGLGLWIQAGEQMARISGGLKPLPSSYSATQSHNAFQTSNVSTFSATTEGSWKDGGRAGATTQPSTKSSGGYTAWSEIRESQYAPNTSLQPTTQQTGRREESTPHGTSSSHQLRLDTPPDPSSLTPSWVQSAWTRTTTHPPLMRPNTDTTSTSSPDTTRTMSSSSSRPLKRVAVLANVSIPSIETGGMVLAAEGQRLPLSPLRLQCPAKERLHRWRPVASRVPLDSLGQPQPLTPAMLTRVEDVLHTAWAPNTAETYGTGLAAFHWFCDQADIAEVDRAPASRELLEVFTSTLAGVYSPSTISNYLAGVRAWHIIHGLELNSHKPTMDALLKAAVIMSPPDAQRAKRPPLRLEKIAAIKTLLDLSKPLDSAVFACLTTTFWGTVRLGEFTLPDKIHFDAATHIAWSTVRQVTD
jgi:hypothetical protein